MRIIYKVERLRSYQLDKDKVHRKSQRKGDRYLYATTKLSAKRTWGGKLISVDCLRYLPIPLFHWKFKHFYRTINNTQLKIVSVHTPFAFQTNFHQLATTNHRLFNKQACFFYGCIFHQWICTTELNQFVWTNGFLLFWICFSLPPSSVYAAAELNEIEHNLRKCPADAEV